MQKIIIICGPTASGKTRVSIELAKRLSGEIISADSQQVWRGFDIGTAKANLKERSEIPHHLVDIADPSEHFDGARFVELGDRAIADICSRGKVPFVVGGTGMYLRMLERGICAAPPRDAAVRAGIEGELAVQGVQSLHEQLVAKDPESAAAIDKNDRLRIVRALEILRVTGKKASELRRDHSFTALRYDALKLGLDVDRAELYRRIDERLDYMVSLNLIDEVRGLIERYGRDCQPMAAVGYREFASYCAGELELAEAVRLAKQNSRHLAKRQLTWFRADQGIRWFAPEQISEMYNAISCHLRIDANSSSM